MDIAAMSVGLSQAKVVQQVNMSVMKMAMDSQERKASETVEMISSSNNKAPVDKTLGRFLDVRA